MWIFGVVENLPSPPLPPLLPRFTIMCRSRPILTICSIPLVYFCEKLAKEIASGLYYRLFKYQKTVATDQKKSKGKSCLSTNERLCNIFELFKHGMRLSLTERFLVSLYGSPMIFVTLRYLLV